MIRVACAKLINLMSKILIYLFRRISNKTVNWVASFYAFDLDDFSKLRVILLLLYIAVFRQ